MIRALKHSLNFLMSAISVQSDASTEDMLCTDSVPMDGRPLKHLCCSFLLRFAPGVEGEDCHRS